MSPTLHLRSLPAFLVALLLPLNLHAAQHLLTQELFHGIHTLTSSTPGNLGTVSAPFVQRPVGPRTAPIPSPGWSAEIPNTSTTHTLDLTSSPASPARDSGMFGAWYYFSSISTDNVNAVRLIDLTNGNDIASIAIDSTFNLSLTYLDTPDQPNIATLKPNTWYWIALAWHSTPPDPNSGAISYSATWLLREATGAAKTIGTPVNNIPMGTGRFTTLTAGATNSGGFAVTLARYGAPSLYSLATLADATYPAALIPPVPARHTWYINPATGSDTNTGLTPAQAWQTVTKINTEAQNLGILTATGGTAHGDILIFDTARAPLTLGTNSLSIPTDAITLQPAPGQRYIQIQAEETITSSSWTKTPAYTHIYQTPDTGTAIVIWESDRWLNHPTGYTFASIANNLDTTPGSFWTDGTTAYIHPFRDTDPASDGKTYTRSQYRGTGGDSAIGMSGNSWSVTGLHLGKTCLCDPGSNDPILAYCFQQTGPSTGGTCAIRDSYLSYGSKHILGFTADSTDSTILATNIIAEQASPYADFGGQSPFVSFMDTGSGNTNIYSNCTSLHNAGRIGFTTGAANPAYPAFITHGPANAYKSLQFLGCHLPSGTFNDQGTVASGALIIRGSGLRNPGFSSPGVLIQNSRIQGGLAFNNGGTLENSRLISDIDYTANSPATLSGTVTIRGSLINLRNNPTPRGGHFSPFAASSPLTLTFDHNTFTVPKTSDLTLINYLTNSNTLTFTSNTYSLDPTADLIGSYNNTLQTFQQWQTLGFDQNSKLISP